MSVTYTNTPLTTPLTTRRSLGLGLCVGFFFFIAVFIIWFVDFEKATAKALESRHLRKMGEAATNGEDDSDDEESATGKLSNSKAGLGPLPDSDSNML